MMNWIRRKLITRRREIFAYWNGVRLVRADPMPIYRGLMNHPKMEIDNHPQLIDADDGSREIVLRAIREVFGVDEYDNETEEGLIESETINLLWSFFAWCNSKKKPTNTSPTLSEPAEKPSPEHSVENSTTKPPSESGLILDASKFDMPRVS